MSAPARHRRPLTALLATPELRAAVLDGELVGLGSGYVCIDEPETPHDRARSLGPELTDARAILCDRTAAWVWGWCPPPPALATCVSIAARVPSPVRRRLCTREAVIDASEVVVLDSVRVTTRLRTVFDLARHDDDDLVVDLLVSAIGIGDVTPVRAMAELQRRPGIAHLRRARRRLELAISRC